MRSNGRKRKIERNLYTSGVGLTHLHSQSSASSGVLRFPLLQRCRGEQSLSTVSDWVRQRKLPVHTDAYFVFDDANEDRLQGQLTLSLLVLSEERAS